MKSMITAFGETKSMSEWVKDERCAVSQPSLSQRLTSGMSPEEAISLPPVHKGRTGRNPVKIGEIFERLTVIEEPRMETTGKKKTQLASKVKCKCQCGKITDVWVRGLRGKGSYRTVSCGCYKIEQVTERMRQRNLAGLNKGNITHNMSRTRLYKVYRGMLNRCYYEKDMNYKNYGGRGITVYSDWRNDFTSFANLATGNGYDENLEIERINNNGNYCPENCKFTDHKNQCNNTRSNVILTAFNQTKTLAAWSEDQRCCVDYNTLRYRVQYYGWDTEKALTKPSIRKST